MRMRVRVTQTGPAQHCIGILIILPGLGPVIAANTKTRDGTDLPDLIALS